MIARNDMNMTSGLVQNGLRTSDSEAALDAALASPRLAADLEHIARAASNVAKAIDQPKPRDWRDGCRIEKARDGWWDVHSPDRAYWLGTSGAWRAYGGEDGIVLGENGVFDCEEEAKKYLNGANLYPANQTDDGSPSMLAEDPDKSGCTRAAAQREGESLIATLTHRLEDAKQIAYRACAERDAAQKLCVEQARKLALYEPRAGSMDMDRPAHVQISLWLTITRDDIHVGEDAGEAAQRMVARMLSLGLNQWNSPPPAGEINVVDWQYTDHKGE